MALNCILWWGSTSGILGSEELPPLSGYYPQIYSDMKWTVMLVLHIDLVS